MARSGVSGRLTRFVGEPFVDRTDGTRPGLPPAVSIPRSRGFFGWLSTLSMASSMLPCLIRFNGYVSFSYATSHPGKAPACWRRVDLRQGHHAPMPRPPARQTARCNCRYIEGGFTPMQPLIDRRASRAAPTIAAAQSLRCGNRHAPHDHDLPLIQGRTDRPRERRQSEPARSHMATSFMHALRATGICFDAPCKHPQPKAPLDHATRNTPSAAWLHHCITLHPAPGGVLLKS